MGKTFKDSSSKRDRGFRFSRNEDGRLRKTAEKGKKMKHKRNFKTYEEADTYEE